MSAQRQAPARRAYETGTRSVIFVTNASLGSAGSDTMERVPDRLNSLDASFLYLEEATTAMHVGSVMVFDPPERRLRLRPAGAAHLGPDRVRAALPPAGPRDPRPPGQPGVGRRRELRRHLPRAPVGPARSRAPTSSCRSSSPGSSRGRSTATARCGRSTSSRGWRRAGSRSSPSRTRPSSTASTPSTSPTSSSTATPAAEGLVTDTWRPPREPSDVELLTGALVDAVRRPSEVVENIRGGFVDVRAVGARAPYCRRRCRRRRWPALPPGRRRTQPAQRSRSARPAATSWSAPTSRTTARSASRLAAGQLRRRRHDQRRRARDHLRARSAPGC